MNALVNSTVNLIFTYFKLKKAICTPSCQNGGICLSYNVCQCPQNYRGPQCQYDVESCTPKLLQFNGAYNCTGDNDQIKCVLSCPQSVSFEYPPAAQYICRYEKGQYEPSITPKCNYCKSVCFPYIIDTQNQKYILHSS